MPISQSIGSSRKPDASAIDFLHGPPFLFRGSIYTRFPAHASSSVEALILPKLRCPVFSGEHYTLMTLHFMTDLRRTVLEMRLRYARKPSVEAFNKVL